MFIILYNKNSCTFKKKLLEISFFFFLFIVCSTNLPNIYI